MAKSVGEFLFDQAKKAGIAESEPFMQTLAQDKSLFEKNLPDEIVTGIDSKLISLTDAKNNHPEIKAYYHKQALDGVDSEITRILEEEKDDTVKTEVLAEKNSYKKIGLLTRKLKELENKKANAKQTDKKEFQDQIDALHAQLRAEKEKIPQIQKEADDKVLNFKKDYTLRSMLQAYKTTLDELDPEVRVMTLSQLINKELQEKKAQFMFDDHDNFVLLNSDGTNHYDGDTNKQVAPKAFIEKLLSRNKLLKVNDQSSSGNGENRNGQTRQPVTTTSSTNGEPKKNHTLSDLADESLKNFEKNSTVSVMG